MNMSAIRRTFLLSAMSLVLGTGLVTHAVAGEQLDTIKKNGTLNVGLEGTYPPFSFVGEDGKLTGFEVEFSEALAKELGIVAIPVDAADEPGTSAEFVALLEKEGPIMVVLSAPQIHAVVIYKMETDGTDGGTTVWFHDPYDPPQLESPKGFDAFMSDVDQAYVEGVPSVFLHPGGRKAP